MFIVGNVIVGRHNVGTQTLEKLFRLREIVPRWLPFVTAFQNLGWPGHLLLADQVDSMNPTTLCQLYHRLANLVPHPDLGSDRIWDLNGLNKLLTELLAAF